MDESEKTQESTAVEEKAPPAKAKRVRSQKQIEWSRKLGQRSRQLKKEKIMKHKIEEDKEKKEEVKEEKKETKTSTFLNYWYIGLIPVGYLIYKFCPCRNQKVHVETKKNVDTTQNQETAKYSLQMNWNIL